jgi:hypothetical protein
MWLLIRQKNCSSGRGGGGDAGIIAGTAQDITTMDGLIITAIRIGMEGSPMTGGITIDTMSGKGTPGIIVPFPIGTWTGIGEKVVGDMTTAGIVLADLIEAHVTGTAVTGIAVIVIRETGIAALVDKRV